MVFCALRTAHGTANRRAYDYKPDNANQQPEAPDRKTCDATRRAFTDLLVCMRILWCPVRSVVAIVVDAGLLMKFRLGVLRRFHRIDRLGRLARIDELGSIFRSVSLIVHSFCGENKDSGGN